MKIKKFIDIYIPTTVCNLKCHYCYISQLNNCGDKVATFSHSPSEIRAALSQKRLGGVCMLNFCAGGETLLSDEVLPIVRELCTEGHYVMVVTNGTVTKRLSELEKWPKELRHHLFFKFSLHYLELLRLGLLDRFSDNVNKVRNMGYSITVEITPSDELIPYKEQLKMYCMDNFGALCHCTIARDDRKKGIDILSQYSIEEYNKLWDEFGSELFRYKMGLYQKKKNEFCYAGAWSYYINLKSGAVKQCYCGEIIDNIYKNVDIPLNEIPIGHHCTLSYCYNGHAFLGFGDIPYLDNVTYTSMRNRVTNKGTEWLEPEMKEAMNSKLVETNGEYSAIGKKIVDLENFAFKYKHKAKKAIKKIIKK